jgi:enoyl-CoA hydratase
VQVPAFERIEFERRGAALVMRLNRPEKLNAVDGLMHRELAEAFRSADADADSQVIVLTGAGRAFCAGGDVDLMDSESGADVPKRDVQVHDPGRTLIDAVLWVEKPIIAMINGAAVGLGATLALLSDVPVASDKARIGDRHVNVGLVAGDGGAAIWPLLIGINRAKELLMTGRLLSGQEALDLGLVNHVVASEMLEDFVFGLAEELAALPPYAVRATKAAVNRQLRRAVEDVLDVSIAFERLSLQREDHREAARAFLQARQLDRPA